MTDPLGELRDALRRAIPPETPPDPSASDQPWPTRAVYRFLSSWAAAGELGADQAVLLRQALRWASPSDGVFIGAPPQFPASSLRYMKNAGLEWSPSHRLSAGLFRPKWCPELEDCDTMPEQRARDKSFAAEAYLKSVHYPQWRSAAQKEAAWATLTTKPGATKVVVLPTGSGKSLCFQLLPRFCGGLTVVVVPTVALAIDQQASAAYQLRDLPNVEPCFFASDDDPDATAQRLREKRTRLLFASPESLVSGRLRPILDEFAKTGWLENLVVDEAHLIETWGAFFRIEFQLLASARRRWLKASNGQVRTFLFSATMTPQCRKLLGTMFSEGDNVEEFVCQRLRPEIRYYNRLFNDPDERKSAVVEALWHIPRPAILYVTEREEAEGFAALLRQDGFQRVGCFHGDTGRTERRDLLRRWKSGELDLMVATSAFGVGVDKADVRAVVHACFPENLDRYYQEVGRGGRDGCSAVSVLLPTPHDRDVADGISVKLMTPELIQKRWSAMFSKTDHKEDHIYALPVASRRTALIGDRTFGENIRWNKRLLLQLERAGRLEILDVGLRDAENPDDEPEEWAVVNVKFPPYTPRLADLIRDQRDLELEQFREGLIRFDEFLNGQRCASRVIGKLYGIPSDQRGCPGCPYCRRENRKPLECEPLKYPEAQPFDGNWRSDLLERCPSPALPAERSDFINFIYRCVTEKKIRQFYCADAHFDTVLDCFSEAFSSNDSTLHRLNGLSEYISISLTATLPLAFLHIGTVNSVARDLTPRLPSVHFLCGVQNPKDHNGRQIWVSQNWRSWPSMESWFATPLDGSLPCSPTTL